LESILENQNRKIEELLKVSRVEDKEYEKLLLAELKAGREEQKDWHRNEEESRCYESLRTTDYEFNKNKNPDRIPGTCKWFLRHPRYQTWQAEEASSWLWVTADPGCGKSVLSKFLIDDYKSTRSADIICYFFFKDDSVETKSATHALCGLLHQVFSQNNALLKHAMPEFRRNRDKLSQLFDTLWNIFIAAAADVNAGNIICVLDALDECTESTRLPLIRKLAGFYSNQKTPARLKFIITSRPNTPIGDAFWSFGQDPASVQLMGENEKEMEDISVEIDLVIKEKVRQFNGIRRRRGVVDDAHIAIQEQLDHINNRTYLWISLIFPELEKNAGLAKRNLIHVIETIPSTVDGAYERILAQSSDTDQAKRLLHIVIAAVRPLTLSEMNVALSIRDDSTSLDSLELEPEASFRTRVRELCGLFVVVNDSKIYLIHQTAKDFLVAQKAAVLPTSRINASQGSWKHSLHLVESNLVLAEICISYLLFDALKSRPLSMHPEAESKDVQQKVNQYIELNTFLDYAAKHWAGHFREARVKEEMTLVMSARALCDANSKRFLTWFQVYWTAVTSYSRCPQDFTDLMVASYFGHETVVRLLLREGTDVNEKESHGRTALHEAARKGYEVVVRLLLEHGADVTATDQHRQTALHLAISNSHAAVVRQLLKNRAGVDATDEKGWTPLHEAAELGDEGVAQQLLEGGADVAAIDRLGRTALHEAAENGHEAVVQLLLKRGADVATKAAEKGNEAVSRLLVENGSDVAATTTVSKRTALHLAAAMGHEALVRWLLEKGAPVAATDRHGRMALYFAVESGHEAVAQVLREKATKDDSRKPLLELDPEDSRLTPLHKAASLGQEELAKQLLEDGVDIAAKDDDDGETALHMAASKGHRAIVRLLLRYGADISTTNRRERTALHAAAVNGHEPVLRELLENGADATAVDKRGWMALRLAASNGHEAAVRLLTPLTPDY
jgi:ankyrin repeat domain-containing protein 50